MAKVQILREFVKQRLTAAAEEILGLFERTMAEYEDEIGRQRGLLRDAEGSETRRDRAVFPANKTFTVIKEVPSEQQDWSSSLDQEDPEPPHIKEEQKEVWTSQEGEQLQRLEEADIKFPMTLVPVKSEEDEEKPESSQLHHRQTEQMETGADGEDCGGPEPDSPLQPDRSKTSPSSETEDTDVGLKQRTETRSGFSQISFSDATEKSFSCSECGKMFGSKDCLQIHRKHHMAEKTFICQFCGKKFTKSSNLTTHLRVHTGEKPFTCSVCNTSFSLRCTLVNHIRVHTGEKPFSCSVCSKRFSKKANLTTHMALHTEEKPFKCSICDKRFTWHSQIKNHKCVV